MVQSSFRQLGDRSVTRNPGVGTACSRIDRVEPIMLKNLYLLDRSKVISKEEIDGSD